ncbi:MAG: hypothetical protein ACTSPY_00645 [Candidatus Helarchaeota archaeon]
MKDSIIESFTLNRKINLSKEEKIAVYITILTISPFQIITFSLLIDIIIPIWVNPMLNILMNLISSIFFLVIPSIPLIILHRRSRLENGQLYREDRYLIFFILIPGYIIAIFLYNIIGVSFVIMVNPLIFYTISYLFVLLIDFIITTGFKFKTSMHISGGTCAIISLSFYYGSLILLLLGFIAVIAWARWKAKGHTIIQLISGWTNGIFTTLICQILLLSL